MYGEFYKEVMNAVGVARQETFEKRIKPVKTKIMSAAKKGLRKCCFQIDCAGLEDVDSYNAICSFLKTEGFNFEIEERVIELNIGDLVRKVFTIHW